MCANLHSDGVMGDDSSDCLFLALLRFVGKTEYLPTAHVFNTWMQLYLKSYFIPSYCE